MKARNARGALLLCGGLLAPAFAAEGPRVTVLPGGEAIVEETVEFAAGPAGRVNLPRAANLLPWSIDAALVSGTEPLEIVTEPPLTQVGAVLQRCVGATVRILPAGPEGAAVHLPDSGILAAVGDGQSALVQFPGLGLVPVRAERIACLIDGDQRRAIGLLLPARSAAAAVRLRYRVDGWSWQARHRLDLAESGDRAQLAVRAVIDAPPDAQFDQAQLRVVEGDIPRAGGPPRPVNMIAFSGRAAMAPGGPVGESESLDLMVFDLPDRQDIKGPATLVLPLRPAVPIPVEDVMVLEMHRSPLAPLPDPAPSPRRHLRFVAEGDKPIPGGVVEVGLTRADGSWLLLGETTTPRVAPGSTADLVLGEVRDLTTTLRRPSLAPVAEGPYQREATLEIDLENHRAVTTRIEVTQDLQGPFELVESDPAPDRRDATSLTWRMALARQAVKTIRVRVRVEPRVRP